MGSVATITNNSFPRQGRLLLTVVKLWFHHDMSVVFYANVVRDDAEQPFITIFKLNDGRYILSTECQYAEA